jgi:excisionase family DNA binding protein
MAKSDAVIEIERIAFTVEEAAAALGIDVARMGGLVRVGSVPHMTLGQRVLISKKALEQWLIDECLANVARPAISAPTPVRHLRRGA